MIGSSNVKSRLAAWSNSNLSVSPHLHARRTASPTAHISGHPRPHPGHHTPHRIRSTRHGTDIHPRRPSRSAAPPDFGPLYSAPSTSHSLKDWPRATRGRSRPPPPFHRRRSSVIRIYESKPDRQLHRCLHTGAMDESNTGAPRTPDLTDGKDVPGGCACGRSRPPPPFHRRRSSIVYMFKTEPDRQLRGCLYTGVMDKSNTCSWDDPTLRCPACCCPRTLSRHHPLRSATNIDAGVSLHAACNANRVDANRTVV